MPDQFFQPLPIGRSDFETLRIENRIYVDKTRKIFDLCHLGNKIFLSRPRRFGKSLLVSTFESLFRFGLRDFKGLAIEALWNDKTYEVVRLDFSGLKALGSIDAYEEALQSLIRTKFAKAGFSYSAQKGSTSFFDQFGDWLNSLEPSSLVILVDEYDAPLTFLLDDPKLFESVRNLLSRFYAALKEHEGRLRFFFMTGITKFRGTSLFSEFNIFKDISLDEKYGTLLGITEKELEYNFDVYLRRAESALGMSRRELINELKANYDGFSFDRRAMTHVFCPWSILNFLATPEEGFQNYWYESAGTPAVLRKYMEANGLLDPIDFNEKSAVEIGTLNTSNDYADISPDVLLTQAGYLTIKKELVPGIVELGYPNREVSSSMARLYADAMLRTQNRLPSGIPFLPKILSFESLDKVVDYFNKAVNALDYQRFPIRDEASCRASIELLLLGAALMPEKEVHSAHGRSDLEINAGSRRWVFEFKYCSRGSNAASLLSEAEKQIISRHYGETPHGKKLLRAALVFSEEERRFVAWKLVGA